MANLGSFDDTPDLAEFADRLRSISRLIVDGSVVLGPLLAELADSAVEVDADPGSDQVGNSMTDALAAVGQHCSDIGAPGFA